MSPVTAADLTGAARRLDWYLRDRHLRDGLLVGPDPGIRFNARLYRFAKSYTRFIPWRDDLVYMQAQKYWIEANLAGRQLGIVSDAVARETIAGGARAILSRQRPEGYWAYPNPEWEGRIATVEGNYGAIGLLLAAEVESDDGFVEGARKWHDYAVSEIGFQESGDTLSINYFGNRPGGRVPNNAASTVRAFAMLAEATGDERYLEHVPGMMRFMIEAQLPSGELPYAVAGVGGSTDRIHFLCQQYNAFQFMNLVDYRRVSGDPAVDGLLANLARFLADSLLANGQARYDCDHADPDVLYYAVACARALSIAREMGLTDQSPTIERAFARVLEAQRENGSFPYSRRNYRVLRDQRPYPRYLAMILTFLAQEATHRT